MDRVVIPENNRGSTEIDTDTIHTAGSKTISVLLEHLHKDGQSIIAWIMHARPVGSLREGTRSLGTNLCKILNQLDSTESALCFV
jgi:hypothetical protein